MSPDVANFECAEALSTLLVHDFRENLALRDVSNTINRARLSLITSSLREELVLKIVSKERLSLSLTLNEGDVQVYTVLSYRRSAATR